MSFLYLSIAATIEAEGVNPVMGLNHLAEDLLLQTALLFKVVIEAIALLILALAIIKAVKKLLFRDRSQNREEKLNQVRLDLVIAEEKLNQVRLDLGIALALSLEFLLAADIAATAVSPSWNAVGKLAAISAIRTFLNFFLEKEVKQLAKEKLEKSRRRTEQ